MEYRFDPSMSKSSAAPALTAAAAAQLQIQLPFMWHFLQSITSESVRTFELTFLPRVAKLVDVAVGLYLGGGTSGAMHSNGRRGMGVPARGAHAVVVAPRDGVGPYGDAAGHGREHGRASAARARGAGLVLRCRLGRAEWAQGESAED